jgi:DNA-3-methyladenine glycosylase
VSVAPSLLGARLTSTVDGRLVQARITEVEAYAGELDPASHAYRGPTRRNAVMFGEAGHLYCYFIYGMHWCANVVCEQAGTASAVLLRAAEIVTGVEHARERAPGPTTVSKLASGPGRLARCLGLTGALTGADLLDRASLVRLDRLSAPADFRCGPRVGVSVGTEQPWRFWLPDDPTVSQFRPGGRKRVRGHPAD